MADASAKYYSLFFKSLFNKEIDIDTDVIKLMLTTSGYVPSQDTHQYKSSVTNEVSGTGYTATGVTVTGVTVTYDSASNTLKIDGADASWSTATFTARYAVLYDSSPATDATRPLIGYVDLLTDQVLVAGSLQVIWDASGFATVTVA